MNVWVLATIIVGITGATAVGTRWVRWYATTRDILDLPNARSSHSTPTPRGGGIVIVAAWTIGIPALALAGLLPARVGIGLAGGGIAVAVIGWWDDLVDLRPEVRLLVQAAAAAWTVAWLDGFSTMQLGSAAWVARPVGSILASIGLVWLINLYNFMDGIDGIAGIEAVTAGATVGSILLAADVDGLSVAAFGLAAASAGFLVWNWPPATIFMGDVGSGFLGYAFGAIALAADRVSNVPASVLLIPLGVFICDATFTVVRRFLRGERLHVAHRSHAYQLLVQAGWSHRRVTVCVLVVNLGLAVVAHIAWRTPEVALWLQCVVVGLLMFLGVRLVRSATATGRTRKARTPISQAEG